MNAEPGLFQHNHILRKSDRMPGPGSGDASGLSYFLHRSCGFGAPAADPSRLVPIRGVVGFELSKGSLGGANSARS